jgi:hypothetical protein
MTTGLERHNRDAAAYAACKWLIDEGYKPGLPALRALADECFPSRGSFASYWQRIATRWVETRGDMKRPS